MVLKLPMNYEKEDDENFRRTRMKTGKWVYEPRKRIDEHEEYVEVRTELWCKCSNCGYDYGFQKMKANYCGHCGARMIGEEILGKIE